MPRRRPDAIGTAPVSNCAGVVAGCAETGTAGPRASTAARSGRQQGYKHGMRTAHRCRAPRWAGAGQARPQPMIALELRNRRFWPQVATAALAAARRRPSSAVNDPATVAKTRGRAAQAAGAHAQAASRIAHAANSGRARREAQRLSRSSVRCCEGLPCCRSLSRLSVAARACSAPAPPPRARVCAASSLTLRSVIEVSRLARRCPAALANVE